VTAQLTLTGASLARLLSVTGAHTDFVLSSPDGRTTVRVGLAVATVPDAELALGKHGVVLDWTRSTITRGSMSIPLTRMELRLLLALMEFAPGVASRQELVARLWPSRCERASVVTTPLTVWVYALRRRFAAIGLPGAIRTVRNMGYSLTV
jgi:DNA-binding response OmpR family regulator